MGGRARRAVWGRRFGASLIAAAFALTGAAGCGAVDRSPEPQTAVFTSGSRLRAVVFDGGNGARLFQRWHDSELEQDCRARLATDGRVRCLPLASTAYLDAACTQPVHLDDQPEPDKYVTAGPFDSPCRRDDWTFPVFERGEPLSVTELHHIDFTTGRCTGPVSVGEASVWSLDAEVSPSLFVAATPVVESRGARLGARILAFDDDAREIKEPYDLLLDRACDLPLGESGPCISPRAARVNPGLSGDEQCTLPVASFDAAMAECPLPEVVYTFDQGSCQGGNVQTFEVGSEVGLDEITAGEAGDCAPVDVSGVASRYVGVGAAIPVDAFDSVRIEPLDATGRVAVSYLTTGDGQAIVGRHLVDTERGMICAVQDVCGELRCATDYNMEASLFLDETCSTPVVRVYGDDCVTPNPATALVDSPACGSKQAFAIDAEVTLDAVYELDAQGACTPGAVEEPPFRYHLLGEARDPDFFPLIEAVTE